MLVGAGLAGVLADAEIERFLAAAEALPTLGAGELDQLNVVAEGLPVSPKGLF